MTLPALRLSYAVSAAAILLLSVVLHIAGAQDTRIPSTIPFVVAVLVTAFVWGRGPAVIAALTAGVAFNYYFVPPSNAFTIPTWPELIFFGGLLAIAVGMGAATDRARTAKREAAELAVGLPDGDGVDVSNLRRKLEEDPAAPRYILTEPRIGYRIGTAE